MFVCTCIWVGIGLLFFNGTPVDKLQEIYTECLAVCTLNLKYMRVCVFVCMCVRVCKYMYECVCCMRSQAQKSDYWGHINFRKYFFTSLCVYTSFGNGNTSSLWSQLIEPIITLLRNVIHRDINNLIAKPFQTLNKILPNIM
jgi:hypothetical protein